jgi:alanyl-tRNA synthetase
VKCEFLGYDRLQAVAPIAALVKDGRRVTEAAAGTEIEVVTTQTPFYGAAGGQVGDLGVIAGPAGRMTVTDTLRLPGDLIVHVGKVDEGVLRVGEQVQLSVDEALRRDTALNHTATHILHAVLRQVLGDHVKQAGSLVAPERLRFDFTHFTAVTTNELREIERLVNDEIRTNRDLHVHVMGLEEALKTGAMALFEEKYGDTVRLVEIPGFSRELCGGTHTHSTGDIGLFQIVQETSVAAGVRRIEALTGRGALTQIQQQQQLLQQAAGLLKSSPAELPERIDKLLANQKQLEKELESLKSSLTAKRSADMLEGAEEIGGVKVLVTQVEADNPKILREVNDRFKEKLASGVVVLGATHEDKAFLLVGVTSDLTKRIHAGNLIKEIAHSIDGSGGGRPDMAQAGGTKPQGLAEALDLAKKLLQEKLS